MNMSRIRMVSLLFAVLFCVPLAAFAQTSIAVVDMQKLLSESRAAKNIQEQMQTRKDAFLSELSGKEQALRDTEQKLLEERGSLSKEDFAKRAQGFEKSLGKTRQIAKTRKRALDETYAKAMVKLRSELYKVVKAVASEKGYDLVISRLSVIVGDDSIDITDEAMKRLNIAISEVVIEDK